MAQEDAIQLPCGSCPGCRLERSRQWALRCKHEADLHINNSFLTLTFNEAHLPLNGSLDVRCVQLFMKRLRRAISDLSTRGTQVSPSSSDRLDSSPKVTSSQAVSARESASVRFFACGEYGGRGDRPHYHILLFGWDFPDKVFAKMSGESRLYSSKMLSSLWTYIDPATGRDTGESLGYSWIGSVTVESAAYVARYIVKKRFGKDVGKGCVVDEETGEVFPDKKPEFIVMSRRPGIGYEWFKKFNREVYTDRGAAVMVGNKGWRPPRFYDEKLKLVDPARYDWIAHLRERKARLFVGEGTAARLAARERVAVARMKLYSRRIEQ